MQHLALMMRRLAPIWVLLAVIAGCLPDGTGPSGFLAGPPYLAIVTDVDALPGVPVGDRRSLRVQGIVDGRVVDTTIITAPTDTAIISVRPAEYQVTISDLPGSCISRQGNTQSLLIPDSTNTGIVRFLVICRPIVKVEIATEGADADTAYLFRLTQGAESRVGTLRGNDTLFVENVREGSYDFELENVAPNCAVTSNGGARAQLTVPASGGVVLSLRVTCGTLASRPRFLRQTARYDEDGTIGFTADVTDPEGDYSDYGWYLTDCRGRSLGAETFISRRGLQGTRIAGRDTTSIIAVFESGLSASALAGRCAAIRLGDLQGGTTPVEEVRLTPVGSSAPIATTFNAQISGGRLNVSLSYFHPADDALGIFPRITARDGVFFPQDGKVDIGIYTPVGYLDPGIPSIPIGGNARLQIGDVFTVEVFLFDRQGNFRSVSDRFLNE